MTDIATTDLQSYAAWASLFATHEHGCEFTDADIELQFFGGGEASWMKLSHYTSETSATEYSFMPLNDAARMQAKRHTFEFLQTFDYSLPKLLAWLKHAPFVDTDIADEVTIGEIRICRNHARASEPAKQHVSKESDTIFEEYDDEKNPS